MRYSKNISSLTNEITYIPDLRYKISKKIIPTINDILRQYTEKMNIIMRILPQENKHKRFLNMLKVEERRKNRVNTGEKRR